MVCKNWKRLNPAKLKRKKMDNHKWELTAASEINRSWSVTAVSGNSRREKGVI